MRIGGKPKPSLPRKPTSGRLTRDRLLSVVTKRSSRELVGLRLNPWRHPHGSYAPKTPGAGAPFTIGRVVNSACSAGFTARIGGVAVCDRALVRRISIAWSRFAACHRFTLLEGTRLVKD